MNKLKEHEQRVVEERENLFDKLSKLQIFIDSNPIFKELSFTDQTLLQTQLRAMKIYNFCLEERIEYFYYNHKETD